MTQKFINEFDFKVPMYIDTMDDSFNNTFHIWPDKAIIISCDKGDVGSVSNILFTAQLNDNASRSTTSWTNDIINFINQHCD